MKEDVPATPHTAPIDAPLSPHSAPTTHGNMPDPHARPTRDDSPIITPEEDRRAREKAEARVAEYNQKCQAEREAKYQDLKSRLAGIKDDLGSAIGCFTALQTQHGQITAEIARFSAVLAGLLEHPIRPYQVHNPSLPAHTAITLVMQVEVQHNLDDSYLLATQVLLTSLAQTVMQTAAAGDQLQANLDESKRRLAAIQIEIRDLKALHVSYFKRLAELNQTLDSEVDKYDELIGALNRVAMQEQEVKAQLSRITGKVCTGDVSIFMPTELPQTEMDEVRAFQISDKHTVRYHHAVADALGEFEDTVTRVQGINQRLAERLKENQAALKRHEKDLSEHKAEKTRAENFKAHAELLLSSSLPTLIDLSLLAPISQPIKRFDSETPYKGMPIGDGGDNLVYCAITAGRVDIFKQLMMLKYDLDIPQAGSKNPLSLLLSMPPASDDTAIQCFDVAMQHHSPAKWPEVCQQAFVEAWPDYHVEIADPENLYRRLAFVAEKANQFKLTWPEKTYRQALMDDKVKAVSGALIIRLSQQLANINALNFIEINQVKRLFILARYIEDKLPGASAPKTLIKLYTQSGRLYLQALREDLSSFKASSSVLSACYESESLNNIITIDGLDESLVSIASQNAKKGSDKLLNLILRAESKGLIEIVKNNISQYPDMVLPFILKLPEEFYHQSWQQCFSNLSTFMAVKEFQSQLSEEMSSANADKVSYLYFKAAIHHVTDVVQLVEYADELPKLALPKSASAALEKMLKNQILRQLALQSDTINSETLTDAKAFLSRYRIQMNFCCFQLPWTLFSTASSQAYQALQDNKMDNYKALMQEADNREKTEDSKWLEAASIEF